MGIVSIIMSDESLECFINNVWEEVKILHDHVVAFTGLTSSIATNTKSIIHKVNNCKKDKFTIVTFISGIPYEKLIVHKELKDQVKYKTINDLNIDYFRINLKLNFKGTL